MNTAKEEIKKIEKERDAEIKRLEKHFEVVYEN